MVSILVHSSTFSASYCSQDAPYDTFNDFAAVAPFGCRRWCWWQHLPRAGRLPPSSSPPPRPIRAAQLRPRAGAASHLAAERFRVGAGFTAQHIPFRGPVEALTEVLTGRVDFYFLPVAAALPQINDGKVVALAVSTAKRATALPNVPTTAEAGLKDAAFAFWNGLFVPAKTPREIVNRLYQETQKALAVPSVQERLAKFGQDPAPMTPEEFDKYFSDDVLSTAKLVKEAGVPQVE